MINRLIVSSFAALLLGAASPVLAQDSLDSAPPPAPYRAVAELVALPDFLPGLGTLYVDPATLPAGPFLGYDRDGQLSATIYMPTVEALESGTSFDDMPAGSGEVASVDIYHNAGHPGVDRPHIHVVVFHDDGAKARLAQ